MTVCGEMWGTEKDGIDGFPIVGEVTIERADIRDSSTKFWLYWGPKDHAFEKKTEVSPFYLQPDMRIDLLSVL
jgi:hypothetical protein